MTVGGYSIQFLKEFQQAPQAGITDVRHHDVVDNNEIMSTPRRLALADVQR